MKKIYRFVEIANLVLYNYRIVCNHLRNHSSYENTQIFFFHLFYEKQPERAVFLFLQKKARG